jgi:hypothetical protein
MWNATPDGSIIDETGKVLFFSTNRFIDDICLGDCCFICGAKPGQKPFNNDNCHGSRHFPSAYARASDEEMKLLQRRWAPTDLRRGAGSRTPAFQPSRHRRAAFAGGRHVAAVLHPLGTLTVRLHETPGSARSSEGSWRSENREGLLRTIPEMAPSPLTSIRPRNRVLGLKSPLGPRISTLLGLTSGALAAGPDNAGYRWLGRPAVTLKVCRGDRGRNAGLLPARPNWMRTMTLE